MPDDYPTTYETALAVVATAMKKARLRMDVLIVNSFMGGVVFSTGGMLQVLIESWAMPQDESFGGIVRLLMPMFSYSIGLFFVVILGLDLFNSNILFFSTGICRRAVSVVDLSISWFVSYTFNLVGMIFVCYIVCHFSGISLESEFITASQNIVISKASYSFVETLIKGMAGNFFVCLAIYLQLMVRPLHVKFLMLTLPVYSFVCVGYTHAVADMYVLIIGSINHAPVSLGKLVWKVFLPGAIGNIVGGSLFGIIVVWYLHIFAVEQDQERLNLPSFELKDEQPQQNMESRVVAQIPRKDIEEEEEIEYLEEKLHRQYQASEAGPIDTEDLRKLSSRLSAASKISNSTRRALKSPKNVFPVYGMGDASERERLIAGHRNISQDCVPIDPNSSEAEYIGNALKRVVSRKASKKKADDPEAHLHRQASITSNFRNPNFDQSYTHTNLTKSRNPKDPNINTPGALPDIGPNPESSIESGQTSIKQFRVSAYDPKPTPPN